MTLKNIATQYEIGRPEWTGQWQSHTHQAFTGNEGPIERPKNFKLAGSQICFGTDKVNYVSNTKSNFQHQTQSFIPSRPAKDRKELCATNYSLGQDRVEYKTAAMTQFSHPSKRQMPEQPNYKNYNQRVDIITGEVYDKNKRSSPYEGFTEAPQHKLSQNRTVLPNDLCVTDPITGRPIIRKGRGFD